METPPGDPKHGDLARGGETLPRDERLGSFAGRRRDRAPRRAPGSLAEGLKTKPRDGLRATADTTTGGGHGPE
jgi:hypothetical protein